MSKLKVGLLGYCGYDSIHSQTGGVIVRDVKAALENDILIFTGGEDIDPSIYGEVSTHSMWPTPVRDALEVDVLKAAIRKGIKILGICRGHQLINAVLGGKLHQDIFYDTGIVHTEGVTKSSYGVWEAVHDFTPDVTKHWANLSLAGLFPRVNSLHNQAVSIPGKGMEVLLCARDGIIEATANEQESIVSFQFHPEWLPSGYFSRMMETGKLIW